MVEQISERRREGSDRGRSGDRSEARRYSQGVEHRRGQERGGRCQRRGPAVRDRPGGSAGGRLRRQPDHQESPGGMTFFPLARTVSIADKTKADPQGVELLKTSPRSFTIPKLAEGSQVRSQDGYGRAAFAGRGCRAVTVATRARAGRDRRLRFRGESMGQHAAQWRSLLQHHRLAGAG